MKPAYYVETFGDPGLATIIKELLGAQADLREQHFHRYAPGQSLNRQMMLYCDCGSQVNCSELKSDVGTWTLHWNKHVIEVQALILMEKRRGR